MPGIRARLAAPDPHRRCRVQALGGGEWKLYEGTGNMQLQTIVKNLMT